MIFLEQLDRIEGKHENIDKNLETADKQLSLLERWCCGCCAGKKPKPIRMSETSGPSQKQPTSSEKMGKGSATADPVSSAHASGNERVKMARIMNDAREDEMEDNLDAVSDILGDLKKQAGQMSETLEVQNEQISRITNTTDTNVAHLKQVNKRTENLLK